MKGSNKRALILTVRFRYSFDKRRGRHTIGEGSLTHVKDFALDSSQCDFNARYRDPTGRCNNKLFTLQYGVAYTPFRR